MDYELERIVVCGRGGSGDARGSTGYVPYRLDDVGTGLSGGLSDGPLGAWGVESSVVFQETVLEDARERLVSQYGASGVGTLVCAWREPHELLGGRRRGRRGGDEQSGEEHVFCVSVHGETREELRLWRVVSGAGSRGMLGGCSQCCHVVQHETPVEAVSVCPRQTDGMHDGNWTLVAVRSIRSVVYYQVVSCDPQGVPGGSSRRGGRSERGTTWKLVRVTGCVGAGNAMLGDHLRARLRDFSWNQFRFSSNLDGVVLDDTGMLWEVGGSSGRPHGETTTVGIPGSLSGSSTTYENEHVLSTYKIQGQGSSSLRHHRQQHQQQGYPAHHLGVRRCEASPLHPRLNLVAWERGVVRVDFREKRIPRGSTCGALDGMQSNRARLVCDIAGKMDSFVTALAVPSRVAGDGCCDLRRFAVSTSSHVYLYDMRKTTEPVLAWEHYMKYPREDMNASTGRHVKWDLQTCFPDGLHFVEGGILVTNSILGKGMVCRWRLVEPAPVIGFDGRALRWTGGDRGGDGRGSILGSTSEGHIDSETRGLRGNSRSGDLRFMWKPLSLERLEPIEPPQLLYSDIYPEPHMPALIRDQTSRMLEIENRCEKVDENGEVVRIRLLPAKVPQVVRRDFGQAIVGSTMIRYGTFGELLIGRISTSDARSGDAGFGRHEILTEEVDIAIRPRTRRTTTPNPTPKHKDSAPRNGVANNNQPYLIHEWLKDKARVEITSGAIEYMPADGLDGMSIDDVPVPQIRAFLLRLIKRLEGIPISAYEAWDIFQRHAAAKDPEHASRIFDNEIRFFLGLGDARPHVDGRGHADQMNASGGAGGSGGATVNGRGPNSTIHPTNEPYTILASHLDAKQLLPLLKMEWPQLCGSSAGKTQGSSDSEREQQRLDIVRSTNQRTLTPSRAFLSVWASLDQADGILSRRDRDPRALQRTVDQLAALDLSNGPIGTNARHQQNHHGADKADGRMSSAQSTVLEAASSFKAWIQAGTRNASGLVRYSRDPPAASDRAKQRLEHLRRADGGFNF